MVVNKPLNRCEFRQMEKCEKALQKTEFRTVDILQPHGCKGYGGNDIRKINHGAEETPTADAGDNNDGKKKCQGEYDQTSEEPNAKKIPHRNTEKAN